MQDPQAIFLRINESKKKLKDLQSSYKEALKSSESYLEIVEELKILREKKKGIEQMLKQQFASEFTQMEDLKIDIASDLELLSDIAMTQIMAGQTVSLTDEYDAEYEPIMKVTFKKAN